MRTLLWLCMLSLLVISQARASVLPKNYPPDCDTLITTTGETYLVRIEWQGEGEVRYTRCDRDNGKVYTLPKQKIRYLKPYQEPVPGQANVPAPGKYEFKADTFDLLTLTNGQRLRVHVLEHDFLNVYYRLYDAPADDRQYMVSNQEVRSLRMADTHRKRGNKQGTRWVAALILALLVAILIL